MRVAVAGGTGLLGALIVEAARDRGHDPVILSRAAGVDIITGQGLESALEGVETIIDASNPSTTGRRAATDFFETGTTALSRSGERAGAAHLLSISIVGIDRVPEYGYYAAKLAQERAAAAGPLTSTILRATQFHEFAGQILDRMAAGPVALVPRFAVQTVAAASVAGLAIDLIETSPAIHHIEVAGPERGDLVDQARRLVAHNHRRMTILPLRLPGRWGAKLRSGALCPEQGASIIGLGFSDWLALLGD